MSRPTTDKEYSVTMPMMCVDAEDTHFFLGLAVGSFDSHEIVYACRICMDYSGNIVEVIDERGQGSIQR